MAAASNNGNPLILGAVLIVGAMMYSRQARAGSVGVNGQYRNLGSASMPGSAGTGFSQFVGGLFGSLFAKSTAVPPRWTTYDPTQPSEGVPYDPADPGQVIPLQDLVNGTVHDYATGDRSSYDIPTTQDIFSSVTGGSGGGFMGPGAYWLE